MTELLTNFIGGEWRKASAGKLADVVNPATLETIAQVPLSPAADVDAAARAALAAYPDWRRTPAGERVQVLFKVKALLEEHFEDISKTIVRECGKTIVEARGELRRGVENVEVACGIPAMMQGYNSEDIARGIDEFMLRQPIGVVAIICPFNFPAMIPLWFLPYAVACGNTVVLKPSERVPMTMQKIVALFEKAGLPKGVVQIVHGSKEAVDAILDHKMIGAVSFVGSTNVAKYVYSRAAAAGKRALCQGGAKNPVVVLPDADMETTTRILADSAFGCAGQRCLAASVAVTVGDAEKPITEAIVEAAKKRKVGNGIEEATEM
ncbi:MAG: aldehyde dehydrogenase family protein, partial [Elusimicrobia bacterium]|nr:aldehyde dehydrogenase family protein [Elusimicrobiota bacterium]